MGSNHGDDVQKRVSPRHCNSLCIPSQAIRQASMARKIYLGHGIGVGAFRKIYGGRKRNGSCPSHYSKSSGSIERHILQQLEKICIVEIDPNGRITSNGQRDLDQVVGRITVDAH